MSDWKNSALLQFALKPKLCLKLWAAKHFLFKPDALQLMSQPKNILLFFLPLFLPLAFFLWSAAKQFGFRIYIYHGMLFHFVLLASLCLPLKTNYCICVEVIQLNKIHILYFLLSVIILWFFLKVLFPLNLGNTGSPPQYKKMKQNILWVHQSVDLVRS